MSRIYNLIQLFNYLPNECHSCNVCKKDNLPTIQFSCKILINIFLHSNLSEYQSQRQANFHDQIITSPKVQIIPVPRFDSNELQKVFPQHRNSKYRQDYVVAWKFIFILVLGILGRIIHGRIYKDWNILGQSLMVVSDLEGIQIHRLRKIWKLCFIT